MSVPRKQLICAWCGATFIGDKRHKYCSEEHAKEAYRAKARERFRVRYYVTHCEEEKARQRKRYHDNPERERRRNATWEQKNVERRSEYKHNWYIARKEAANNA